MPKEIEFKFKCTICGKIFTNKIREKAEEAATKCEQTHDVVYIPLMRSDVSSLWAFFVSCDPRYLTETLVKAIEPYRSLR